MKELLPTIIGLTIAMAVFAYAWRQGAFLKISNYFRETQEELKKCTWPTWDELVGSTVVVVVAVALLGTFTVLTDRIITLVVVYLVT